MWCDSVEHTRRDCTEFTEALNAKVVGFNESGRIKLMSTGEELPLMTNRGGMKEGVRSRTVETASGVTAVTSVDVGAISFDDQLFGKLGPQNGSATWVTSLDFENGIRTNQIIDVEANKKRKRDALKPSVSRGTEGGAISLPSSPRTGALVATRIGVAQVPGDYAAEARCAL